MDLIGNCQKQSARFRVNVWRFLLVGEPGTACGPKSRSLALALETAFRELQLRLRKLKDVFDAANVTLGDGPLEDESPDTDSLKGNLSDAIAWVNDARRLALRARAASRSPIKVDQVRRYLGESQSIFQELEQLYYGDLVSHERLTYLERLGNRGSERRAWIDSLKDALEQCRNPMQETSRAFVVCWQELTEVLSVSLQLRPKSRGTKVKR
jgi:hypothetical protein